MTDAVQATGRGDVAAFERLYRLTIDKVTATARPIVVDPGLIEEVVQEVYLEIWRWAGRYDPSVGPALPWLLRIVRHRSIDRVRQCEATRSREHAFNREQEFAAPAESVLDQILQAERHRELRDALGRLTHRQQQALWLTYFQHYTGPQLSVELGIPLGTIKARVRDGLLGLRAVAGGSGLSMGQDPLRHRELQSMR